jgi:hypothetical protein
LEQHFRVPRTQAIAEHRYKVSLMERGLHAWYLTTGKNASTEVG